MISSTLENNFQFFPTWLEKYAELNGITVSELVRRSVIERIEDEHDVKAYKEALAEFEADPVVYSLDEVEKELDLKWITVLFFSRRALKQLKKLDKYTAFLITSWLRKNINGCSDPRQHDKGLTANRSGQWRYRVGDYRIIVEIEDTKVIVLVLEIGHRKNIYLDK